MLRLTGEALLIEKSWFAESCRDEREGKRPLSPSWVSIPSQ